MLKKLFLFSLYMVFVGCTFTKLSANSKKNNKIIILDEKILKYKPKNGVIFSEISDIAYDKKSHGLYMIGDKGYFYIFNIYLTKDKIKRFIYKKAYKLKGRVDIEGLCMNSKRELLISFEGKPKVAKINRRGKIYSKFRLLKKLSNYKIYRNRNSIFEALAYHKRYGVLVVAEYPINHKKNEYQTIYSLKGKEWHFHAQKGINSAVTAIEVMDDGNILVLERAYRGLAYPLITTLKKVYLNRCDKKHNCRSEVLAIFDSSKGWGFNNYEGLTKVGKNRYLMVSDNNAKPFLDTSLVYFKIK